MTAQPDSLRRRRACLTRTANPAPDHDRITILSGELPTSSQLDGGPIHVDLRFIADRDVIAPAALATYFQAAARESHATLEAYADLVLDDLNNELVPRWIWLRLQCGGHQVIQQDQQPGWDNTGLLATIDFS
jgi:7-cyano-7-deazaguanine reductase